MEVDTNLNNEAVVMYDYINNFFKTPAVFVILIIIIIFYFVLFMSTSLGRYSQYQNNNDYYQNNNDYYQGYPQYGYYTGNRSSMTILYIIIFIVFIVLIFLNVFQYYLGYDVTASIKNMFNGNPQVNISAVNKNDEETKEQKKITEEEKKEEEVVKKNKEETPITKSSYIPQITTNKQVFNIPNNVYNYYDAQSLCSAYGSRLASYTEIEESYKDGAEWCNYGWSKDQMAFFPTQQKTFDKLQSIKGHENDCGRPGVNGGYMANPYLKFGVNCYGYKPKIKSNENDLMKSTPIYPRTQQDIEAHASFPIFPHCVSNSSLLFLFASQNPPFAAGNTKP